MWLHSCKWYNYSCDEIEKYEIPQLITFTVQNIVTVYCSKEDT